MKTKISAVMITGIFLVLTTIKAFSQNAPEAKTSAITPESLTITNSKTTNLVFPYAIKSMDKGSRDILAQKAPGVENILQIKAAIPDFEQTNLTVVTADGSLYSYVLSYEPDPARLSIRVNNTDTLQQSLAVFTKDATSSLIEAMAEKVYTKQQSVQRISDSKYEMEMEITGLYVHEDVLYFQLGFTNNSAINYDVQLLRFFIKDKKRSKRTSSQETEIVPLYVLGNDRLIRSNSQQTVTVALPKFTIPDKKLLVVQLMEKDGGRHLSLTLKNKFIVTSQPIY